MASEAQCASSEIKVMRPPILSFVLLLIFSRPCFASNSKQKISKREYVQQFITDVAQTTERALQAREGGIARQRADLTPRFAITTRDFIVEITPGNLSYRLTLADWLATQLEYNWNISEFVRKNQLSETMPVYYRLEPLQRNLSAVLFLVKLQARLKSPYWGALEGPQNVVHLNQALARTIQRFFNQARIEYVDAQNAASEKSMAILKNFGRVFTYGVLIPDDMYNNSYSPQKIRSIEKKLLRASAVAGYGDGGKYLRQIEKVLRVFIRKNTRAIRNNYSLRQTCRQILITATTVIKSPSKK